MIYRDKKTVMIEYLFDHRDIHNDDTRGTPLCSRDLHGQPSSIYQVEIYDANEIGEKR